MIAFLMEDRARHGCLYGSLLKCYDIKIDALKKDDKVCFTVYGNERYKEGDWAPYSQSTVVFGRCRLIEDAEITEARVRELALKYYPDKEEAEQELRKSIQAVQLYEITIEHLSGKQVHEK